MPVVGQKKGSSRVKKTEQCSKSSVVIIPMQPFVFCVICSVVISPAGHPRWKTPTRYLPVH